MGSVRLPANVESSRNARGGPEGVEWHGSEAGRDIGVSKKAAGGLFRLGQWRQGCTRRGRLASIIVHRDRHFGDLPLMGFGHCRRG